MRHKTKNPVCRECGVALNNENWPSYKTGKRKTYKCRVCHNKEVRQYHQSDPNKSKKIRRQNLWKYGITINDYNRMFQRQHGRCAICDMPETEMLFGTIRSLCVDHNHDTGGVRGLLCCKCNQMIGCAKENPEILYSAIEYLSLIVGT